MENDFHAHVDQSLLKVCTKFPENVTRNKGVTVGEDYIFVNEYSF